MKYDLRQYQHKLKNDIRGLFIKNQTSLILCSPTGSGKTVTFADMCNEAVKNGMSVMIVVDRKELVEQSVDKLTAYGLKPEIITGGVKYYNFKANCFVATVQTLKKRRFPDVDLVVIDEAHKQIFDDVVIAYREKNTFIIGATATPMRKGKHMGQLGTIYHNIVQSVEIAELISDGFLSPARTVGAVVSMDDVKQRGGDYAADQMFEVYDKPFLYDGLLQHWIKFCRKQDGSFRKTIVFNINVEHSIKTMNAFKAAGIRCEHVDGKTPKGERTQRLRDFKIGKIDVLCNVDILTTGYDEPSIECVVINRRTKSVPLWLQMCGRGSRIFKGKKDFIILDMGGNTIELGHWERPRKFSLWHKVRGEGIAPQKQCPEPLIKELSDGSFVEIPRDEMNNKELKKYGCGDFIHASAPRCDNCGFIFPKNEMEMKQTEMTEIGSDGNDFFQMPEYLQKPYNEMSFKELSEIQQMKGFKKHWILHQLDPTRENLVKFAEFMDYKPSWVYYAEKNIFNQDKNE
jgi:superfamily II DNA or RNA helicase